MDNINIIILNQWNLDLNSTMEEYGTADDSTSGDLASDFNWDLKRRGLAIAMTIWLIFAKMFWFWFWSTVAKILLKLVGYAGIGLTFGRGYEFVNLTFFQWTDEMGIDLKILAYGSAALTLMNIKELIEELIIEYREAMN
jgi:hypothetical protein